jgi:type I restriction-modification system DNA methylase subunit
MNIAQIEINLQKLIKSFSNETFIYDLLLAYGLPKASITRLKKGNLNLSKVQGEVSWKKKLFFKEEFKKDLHLTISNLLDELKHGQHFIIVTDYKTLLSIDTETDDKLDIVLTDLPKHYDFFLPWAGMKKAQRQNENPADIKAAEKMAKLFDEIKKDNPDSSPEFIHGLNVFLSRLLFCFFAEDTHIFEDNQFTNAIGSHTQADGSDLNTYLDKLFEVLNTPEKKRKNMPEYLKAFPFANGGLFREQYKAPTFTRGSRNAILNSGDQDWSAINPDIFGSMFQAVISVDQRGSLGQHYTSVPNIMRVIAPLFLNDLYEEFEKAKETKKIEAKIKKLKALLNRLYTMKIFDPACGSGNFLIIAYKELRIFEMEIFKEGEMFNLSNIHLSQFYGIEIDDFAHEIAKLSLWLAEHQMNVEFFKEFGRTNPTLPLKEAGQIKQGNATCLDWEEVCPKEKDDEIYILGNPPYLGARVQHASHKKDMDFVFSDFSKYRDLDYIACWFLKGTKYIQNINSKLAFVSTNSICQGLQVGLLWPSIFKLGIEINFAHQSFKWTNNAKGNAGVTVTIIGLSNANERIKTIYSDGLSKHVNGINAYLSDGANTIIMRRSKPLSNFKEMSFGNMPNDGGGLILSENEKKELLKQNPEAGIYLKKLLGASEFIRGNVRYCLWIANDEKENAEAIPFIADRIKKTKTHRLKSKDKGTNNLALRPYQFRDTNVPVSSQIIIPSVSSERREYIPSGFLGTDTIISNSAQVIYDAEPWLFGVINSKIHMVWLGAVGGKLKTDFRYAKDVVYNTFPFPIISVQCKDEIAQAVFRILEEREKHPEKTLAQLYDPDKMPDGLREGHHSNDLVIERCYRSKPFTSDEERLEYLFNLYEKMIAEEKN